MKKKIILLPLSALLLSSLAGCDFLKMENFNLLNLVDPLYIFHQKDDKKDNGEDEDTISGPHVSSINITGEKSCPPGKTAQLSADVTVVGNLATTVTWSSKNEDIATIDETGLVTALKEGIATIVATSTADPTVFAEINFIIRSASVDTVGAGTNSPTTPYFMLLSDEAKNVSVTVSAPKGEKVEDIPDYKKTFTWSVDKEGVIDFEVVEKQTNPTMTVKVTPKGVGSVKLTATNDYEKTKTRNFYFKVIDVDELDYFWQFNGDDRAQFGYNYNENRAGNAEGTATLANLDWEFLRNPVKSINTSVGNTLGFGAGVDQTTFENKAEDLKLTNKNKKTVSRIIVDTASANSLADFTVTVGGTEIINTKAPKLTYPENDTTSIDSGVLDEGLKGDIVLNWDNPEFIPEVQEPGAIYIKAIRIFYEETHTPHIESVTIDGKNELFINKNIELTASVTKVGDLAETVTWTSSDESIATVDQTGKVTGVAPGKVTIYAASTVDPNVKGEFEIDVKIPWVKSVSADLKAPYYFVLGSQAKKVALTVNAPTGASATDIPAEEKLFTWSLDKEGIVSFVDASTSAKPTLAVNVTALAVGEAVLTATNTLDPTIKVDIYFKVITVNQGDYLWQYDSSFRAQFGYDSKEATAGTKEGTATLGDLDWQYERSRVVSLSTSLSGALGFGKKATSKEPQNSESLTLTNFNTKKVTRIIVDTASTNGLATLDIKINGISVTNGPQKVEAPLDNNDCPSIDTGVLVNPTQGDIVLEWQNPDFDPAIHIVDKTEKGPGSIFLKAIRIMYAE